MAANYDSVWAERAAKAILLVRILVGWVSFRRNSKIPFSASARCRSLHEDWHSLA